MKLHCHKLLALGALSLALSNCGTWVEVDPNSSRGYAGYDDFPYFGSSIYDSGFDHLHHHRDDDRDRNSVSDTSSRSVKHDDHYHSSAEKRDQHEAMDRRSSDNDRRDSNDNRRSSNNDSSRSESSRSESSKSDSGGSKSDNDDRGSSRSGR